MRTAIIGTGIAGMGCGYFLHAHDDLTLYEQNDYIGGHTHTIRIEEEAGPVYMDAGFMVFNYATYPNLQYWPVTGIRPCRCRMIRRLEQLELQDTGTAWADGPKHHLLDEQTAGCQQ